ncbi:unnamed protein product, partial [marine sediment metagenome]
ALAADIFGRAGTQLLPMLANGTEGLTEMREEAHKLGIVFDQEAANKAAELTDAMTRVKQATSGLKMAIADKLIPSLMPLIKRIEEVISGMSAWMKEHPGLTKVIVIGTMALGGLLVALGGLLLIMPGLTAALGAFGITLHLALGPIALITLGIAGLIAAGVLLWKNWDKVQLFFKKMWANMKIMFGQAVKFLVKTVLQPFLLYIKYYLGTIVRAVGKIVGIFNKDWGRAIENVADGMANLGDTITDWADNLIESGEESKEALKDVARVAERTNDEMIGDIRELTDEAKDGARERISVRPSVPFANIGSSCVPALPKMSAARAAFSDSSVNS